MFRADHDAGVRVHLAIQSDDEFDPEHVERLTRQLRAELTDLDVEFVGLKSALPAPDNAKGTDPVTLGALIVALSASSGVFTALIETLRDWLDRHSGRHRISMTIDDDSIELERASDAQQQALLDAYLRRHTTGLAD